ncbi:MAG: hypothetical protein NVS4B6_09460 [Mycobacterium sp.]
MLARLDTELVGEDPVRTRIAEIAAPLLVDRMRALYGVPAPPPTLHMCFTGNPGTGTTTAALRMDDLLHRLGYLRRRHRVSVTRDDLVGDYVGHTAPKTKEVIKRAMGGGVFFIDKAYHPYKIENERDYGSEAIEILLQVMENNRADLVVILAGYADKMDRFFSANPGMHHRIAHHVTFPDYTVEELEQIAVLMTDQIGYSLSADAQSALHEYRPRRIRQPWFANARSVRNAIERARLRHARRRGAPGRHRIRNLVCAEQLQRGSRCPADGSTRPRRPTDPRRTPLRRIRPTNGVADPERGSIRLAAITTAGELLIPDIDCKLEVASRNAIWPMLTPHEVDVVVAGRPPADLSAIHVLAVAANTLVVVA